jgi:hypothetical protein
MTEVKSHDVPSGHEVASKVVAQGGPIQYTARDIAWMEAHPKSTQMVSSVSSFIGWAVLLGVSPVLGYVFGQWPGAIAGVVISLFIFAYTKGYAKGGTGLVSWLTLIGGGVLGYQFGGWAGAIIGAVGFFIGSAVIMGGRRGKAQARTVHAAWQAAGEPRLAPPRPGQTHAERTKEIMAAVNAYEATLKQEMVFDRCKLVGVPLSNPNGGSVIDQGHILQMARRAYADPAYYDQYRFGPRGDRYVFWAKNGLTSLHGNLEAAEGMPWATDPGLRERVIPLVKVELAEARLLAGATPSEAVAELNAALGPPNLAAMFLSEAKARQVAKTWWADYGRMAAELQATQQPGVSAHANHADPQSPTDSAFATKPKGSGSDVQVARVGSPPQRSYWRQALIVALAFASVYAFLQSAFTPADLVLPLALIGFGAVPHVRGKEPGGLHRVIRRLLGWLLIALTGLTLFFSVALLFLGHFDWTQLVNGLLAAGGMMFTAYLFTARVDVAEPMVSAQARPADRPAPVEVHAADKIETPAQHTTEAETYRRLAQRNDLPPETRAWAARMAAKSDASVRQALEAMLKANVAENSSEVEAEQCAACGHRWAAHGYSDQDCADCSCERFS